MELSEKLYELRKSNNWSQEELAEKMEVSRQTISKWESNKAIPELNKLVKISEIYHITLDELVKDTPTKDRLNCSNTIKTKRNIKTTLVIIVLIVLFLIIIFTFNIARRISIVNEISDKYKSNFQSIGELKSGRIIENITKRDINKIEETHKEYWYYVSENGERLLRIVSFEDENLHNPIEEIYIDLTKETDNGFYDKVTKIDLKDGNREVIENYEFVSPIRKTTESINNYYSMICAGNEVFSAKEIAFDFNNKLNKKQNYYGWNNKKINGSKNNIELAFDNQYLYLYFDNYQDDIKAKREIISIQMMTTFQSTKEEMMVPEI